MRNSAVRPRFDKDYYDRYYRDPRTRATTPAAMKRHAAFIAAYVRHLEVPIRRVIDVGCGTGTLLRALAKAFPGASCAGVEQSEYLCARYGWEQGSVIDYKPKQPADLVVCNDVLAYLDTGPCARAIDNLAAMTKGALFVGVLTEEDLTLCDERRTDSTQITRPVAWYRRRLRRDFINVGGGLFLKRPPGVTVWHLDRAE